MCNENVHFLVVMALVLVMFVYPPAIGVILSIFVAYVIAYFAALIVVRKQYGVSAHSN